MTVVIRDQISLYDINFCIYHIKDIIKIPVPVRFIDYSTFINIYLIKRTFDRNKVPLKRDI